MRGGPSEWKARGAQRESGRDTQTSTRTEESAVSGSGVEAGENAALLPSL